MPFIIEIERYTKDTKRYSFLSERVDCTLPDYKAAQKFENAVDYELHKAEYTLAVTEVRRSATIAHIQHENGWIEMRLIPISDISISGRRISGYTTRGFPFRHDPEYRIPDEFNCSLV